MSICLKDISEKNFLFDVNVNASLKFSSALEGCSNATQAIQYSQGTRSALGHLRHSGTQAFRPLTHLGTLYSSTCMLTLSGTQSTRKLEALYPIDSCLT